MNEKSQWVNQTMRVQWASYYHVNLPLAALIHLWRHLFTFETLFLTYIKLYHATLQVILATEKREMYVCQHALHLVDIKIRPAITSLNFVYFTQSPMFTTSLD